MIGFAQAIQYAPRTMSTQDKAGAQQPAAQATITPRDPAQNAPPYHAEKVEAAVQARWQEARAFEVREDPDREKFYCLSMFPYPSGRLHIGHVRNYTIGDAISRYQRMLGKNVLQPMGWDAFGLPAENAAIENQRNPADWTRENIAYMRTQLQRLGYAYDWSRELSTCDPDYYRWEQWFFTRLYERGLVYRKTTVVNWDPVDQTVLANEQVVDGRGWRSGAPVQRREIPQWFLKITDYAEELLADLQDLPGWPEAVRTMQANWIGRSEGVEFDFQVPGHEPLRVYTTRPDTIMGVSGCLVAAEHPLAIARAAEDPGVRAFIAECRKTATSEAAIETMKRRGLALGLEAVHPISGARLPVFCANFVLMAYGTGAVMAVPAHDQRDYEFACNHDLPILPVVRPPGQDAADVSRAAFTGHGVCYNSGPFDGLDFDAAFAAICQRLEDCASGQRRINYRLRDWGISRQRYWGCPIPMLYDEHDAPRPVVEQDLPVHLPEEVTFTGVRSPLKNMPGFSELPPAQSGARLRRETDTFDTFFESSWYYARFCCPDNDQAMLDGRANYWLPVDQYVGGVEHAVLHLLYARFFHKLLRDTGLVQCDEPFSRLLTQGMVLKDGSKMSKSRGNTVDPQQLIDRYGADTVRLFVMFAAPPEQSLEWSDAGVQGAHRFLKRLWRLACTSIPQCADASLDGASLSRAQRDLQRRIHQTISKVDDDVGRRNKFNTAISAVSELVNALRAAPLQNDGDRALLREGLRTSCLLLAPIVPHIAEHIWGLLGEKGLIVNAAWPRSDPSLLRSEEQAIVVQVNGKVRARITVPAVIAQPELEASALAAANVQRFIADREIRKIVVVPGVLVNIVAR